MGNTIGSNKTPGMRDSYLFGLITYIIQVFDETVAQYRTIADATTSITNRLKNCRRFAVQSSPNPENRYFFNNTYQVLIREKYRDLDGVHHWSLVLQLSPASKIIQVNIHDPLKAPAFHAPPQNNGVNESSQKIRESVTDIDEHSRQKLRHTESLKHTTRDADALNKNNTRRNVDNMDLPRNNGRSIDNIDLQRNNGRNAESRSVRLTGSQNRNTTRSERLVRPESHMELDNPRNNTQRIESDMDSEFMGPRERPQQKIDIQEGLAEFDLRKLS